MDMGVVVWICCACLCPPAGVEGGVRIGKGLGADANGNTIMASSFIHDAAWCVHIVEIIFFDFKKHFFLKAMPITRNPRTNPDSSFQASFLPT